MLVLKVPTEHKVFIKNQETGEVIVLLFKESTRRKVSIGITAPDNYRILRESIKHLDNPESIEDGNIGRTSEEQTDQSSQALSTDMR